VDFWSCTTHEIFSELLLNDLSNHRISLSQFSRPMIDTLFNEAGVFGFVKIQLKHHAHRTYGINEYMVIVIISPREFIF